MKAVDVLIVGGGLSGLALADHMTRAGVDCLLIEAQGSLGGHILTHGLFGAAFDLGPAWFWPGQTRIEALANRFQLSVFEQYTSGEGIFQMSTGAVHRGQGYGSMRGSYRLEGGVERLVVGLADAVGLRRMLLNARLETLTRSGEGISARVNSDGEELIITASHVALAVPPRIVAQNVELSPGLDAAQMAALRAIPTWMAAHAKIVAIYDRPHWRDQGLSGDAISQRGPIAEIHDASPASGGPYALFGFLGIPADVRAEHPDAVKEAALDQFNTLFGEAMANPMHLLLQDWATVDGVATKWDWQPPRSHPQYGLPEALQSLWDGRLHLTSTETAPVSGGFLEGALEAAELTAARLLKSL